MTPEERADKTLNYLWPKDASYALPEPVYRATVEAFAQAIREAQDEEFEHNCKAVCDLCAKGFPTQYDRIGGLDFDDQRRRWVHHIQPTGGLDKQPRHWVLCEAHAIRRTRQRREIAAQRRALKDSPVQETVSS